MSAGSRTNADSDGVLLDRAAAARYLNVTERWIARALTEGRIPKVKLGLLVRIDKRDLDAFIEAARREATAGPLAKSEPKGGGRGRRGGGK